MCCLILSLVHVGFHKINVFTEYMKFGTEILKFELLTIQSYIVGFSTFLMPNFTHYGELCMLFSTNM